MRISSRLIPTWFGPTGGTTAPPTTLAPTTLAPTTIGPTTTPPTTVLPTTLPTTTPPTTVAPMIGTVCWGHSTGVVEDYIRTFSGNWTGTGFISGVGDAEDIALDVSEYEESETWNIGAHRVKITLNKYAAGSGSPLVRYKNGNSQVNCEADSWHNYVGPFVCLGWVKVRVDHA